VFEETLKEMLQSETENLRNQQIADLNGRRLVSNFATYINQNLEALAKIEDAQDLLTKTVSLLRGLPKVLEEIAFEINTLRREQTARCRALEEFYATTEAEKAAKHAEIEAERVEEAAEKIKEDGGIKPRKIGDRPEKLKVLRKAEESLSEDSDESDESSDDSEDDNSSQ